MVAKKDYHAPKHQDVDVPNLYVIKIMQSLNSRGYVREQFAWQHLYWSLTNEGVEYLREYLDLPETVMPATLRKPKTAARPPTSRPSGGRGFDRDRKQVAPGEGFKPDYRGGERGFSGRGFGRGGYRRDGDRESGGRGFDRQ